MDDEPGNASSDEQAGTPREDGEGQFQLPLPARDSFLSFPARPKLKRPQHPLWTENKAKLIERYLYYFVLITRHGTYIDGFAEPQQPDMPEMWAAKLVLESEPKWFRHFYLFDIDEGQAAALETLCNAQAPVDSKGRKLLRDIRVTCADFNAAVHDLLGSGSIGQREATFCLLDQRTFECHWATLKALAGYKHRGERKIELFYFFPQHWIKRAVSALKRNTQQLADWWGADDWPKLCDMSTRSIMETIISRFTDELGYESATPWPIFDRQDGGRVMYQMIHATDHPEAPYLMSRAYDKAIQPKETPEQLGFQY